MKVRKIVQLKKIFFPGEQNFKQRNVSFFSVYISFSVFLYRVECCAYILNSFNKYNKKSKTIFWQKQNDTKI